MNVKVFEITNKIDCLFNSAFRLTTKKTSKLYITDSLWTKCTSDQWIFTRKESALWKRFHVKMPSCLNSAQAILPYEQRRNLGRHWACLCIPGGLPVRAPCHYAAVKRKIMIINRQQYKSSLHHWLWLAINVLIIHVIMVLDEWHRTSSMRS